MPPEDVALLLDHPTAAVVPGPVGTASVS
jgi:hypothetical protein